MVNGARPAFHCAGVVPGGCVAHACVQRSATASATGGASLSGRLRGRSSVTGAEPLPGAAPGAVVDAGPRARPGVLDPLAPPPR